MRKFPNYSLLQELTMQGMMILLILAYIAYGFKEELGFYSYLVMGVSGVAILFLFRNQMTRMRTAKIIHVITAHTDFNVQKNFVFSGLISLLVLLFSVLHFYLFLKAGKDVSSLYTEYGIGALFGLALWIFEFQKGHLIITEQGIVTGSKLRPSIICWSAIAYSVMEKGNIVIVPKQKFGVRSIHVKGIRATQHLSTLLRMHNKMK